MGSKGSPVKYEGELTSRAFTEFLCEAREGAGRTLPAKLGCPERAVGRGGDEL
jgi:hypothetical protein